MPRQHINDIELYYELTGDGDETIVLVHGSWTDHLSWQFVVPALAERTRVLSYDRRVTPAASDRSHAGYATSTRRLTSPSSSRHWTSVSSPWSATRTADRSRSASLLADRTSCVA